MLKNKIIFMGTPKIASVVLQAILQLDNIEVLAVVCQPDKVSGRKKEISYCEVKQIALQNNIKVLQAVKVSELFDEIKQLSPDLIFTCAFGQFIPEKILDIPKYHCVNLHASLLPKLRGGAPIHWAVINQEKQTGWTLMYMEKAMDNGNIIKQFPLDVANNETYISLYDKLCELSKNVIKNNFDLLFDDNIKSIKQDETKVTFGYNVSRQDEQINWNDFSKNIDAKIRGLYNKPIAFTTLENKIIKIHKANINQNKFDKLPGTICQINKNEIVVATKDGSINLLKIQLEGKKPLEVNQILNGNHQFVLDKKFI